MIYLYYSSKQESSSWIGAVLGKTVKTQKKEGNPYPKKFTI